MALAGSAVGNIDVYSSTNVSSLDNMFHGVGGIVSVGSSSNVTISNNYIGGCDCVSVQIGGSRHVILSNNLIGGDYPLGVHGSSFGDISYNRIIGGVDDAVGLAYCSNLSFQGNRVLSDPDGIYLAEEPLFGIVDVVNCTTVDISNNSIAAFSSGLYGAFDALKISGSTNLTISANILANATTTHGRSTGLSISGSSLLWIDGNNIVRNTRGLVLNNTRSGQIFHNNFSGNHIQAIDSQGLNNTWDNGYPNGGNYWSDNTGTDMCSGPQQNVCPNPDGMGDTPYSFSGGKDRYPLMHPFASAITGVVNYHPTTIVLPAHTKYLTAIVRVPSGVNTSEIVLSSVRLSNTISIAPRNGVEILSSAQVLVVRFKMAQVDSLFSGPGRYVLQVSFNLDSNTNFSSFLASTSVQVISE